VSHSLRYWNIRKAMKHTGIKSSISLADVVTQLLAKGDVGALASIAADDAAPPTSRFQSALAQRIAAANVMWGASDVVDFKVCGGCFIIAAVL
jgi:hypothetical protein